MGYSRAKDKTIILRLLKRKGAKIDKDNASFWLYNTVYYNKPRLAKFLLKHGANLNKRNSCGKTNAEQIRKLTPNATSRLIFKIKGYRPDPVYHQMMRALATGDTGTLSRLLKEKKVSLYALVKIVQRNCKYAPNYVNEQALLRTFKYLLRNHSTNTKYYFPPAVHYYTMAKNPTTRQKIEKLVIRKYPPSIKLWRKGWHYDFCGKPWLAEGWFKQGKLNRIKSDKSGGIKRSLVYTAIGCREGPALLNVLLKYRVPIPRTKDGVSILSRVRGKEILKTLLKHGIRINTGKNGKAWFCDTQYGFSRWPPFKLFKLFDFYVKRGAKVDCDPFREKLLNAMRTGNPALEATLTRAGVTNPQIPIFKALKNNTTLAKIRTLHEAGAPIETELVHQAVILKRYDLLPYLLEHYSSKNMTSLLHGFLLQPNMYSRGDKKKVSPWPIQFWRNLLVQRGYFPDPRNEIRYQKTPLILAVQGGDRKLVEILLKAGANINARAYQSPRDRFRWFSRNTGPLKYAQDAKNRELIRLLRAKGGR